MSVSFGLKSTSAKRKAGAQLAAFGENDDEPEPELTETQKQAESDRLQVPLCLTQHSLRLRALHT